MATTPARSTHPCPRRSSLRATAGAAFAAVLVLLAATAAGLGVVARYLHRVTTELENSIESVRVCEELRANLLLHERAVLDAPPPPAPVASGARILAGAIASAVTQARHYVDNPVEASEYRAVVASTARYLVAARRVAALPADARAGPLDAALSPALTDVQRLLDDNVGQGHEARRDAAEWDRFASGLSVGLIALVGVALALVPIGLRRFVVDPTLALSDAMARFRAGEGDARAPIRGPAELCAIADTFNDMADALARKQRDQIAFLGGVAHDLRNPLAAIKLSVDAAQRARARGEHGRIDAKLELVSTQVARLERMVGDFLDATRIESGELSLELADCDVGAILEGVVAVHRQVAPGREILLWRPSGRVSIACDATRIEQVLHNLLSNAIKYSPGGGAIAVRLDLEPRDAVIAVTDRGIGIAPEDLSRIFEPFRRTGASRELFPGVGLGLSVARRIARAHGGDIEVESVRGEGSTFRLRLPREHERPSLPV